MKESLLKLTKMLAEDEKFLKEFSSKKSVDEQYDFAQKSVSGYTKQEFVDFLDELEKSYELKSDISPEEMEKVSGGADVRTKAAAMAMLALSAVGSAAPMLTGAMKHAVPRGGAHPFFAANDDDDDDILPIVIQPSTIGDPVVDVEVSAVMRANAEELGTIRNQLNDDQLALFDHAEACKDTGPTRMQEVEKMKKLAQNLETKSAMLNMIKQTYEAEKAIGINWVRFPRKFPGGWTGWRMEDAPQIRAKLGMRHQGRIISWLLNKFKPENGGYYLHFEGDKLVLDGGKGPKINLLDDVASYSTEVNTKAGDIRTFITELTQRLNRARVFGQSLKAAGMEVEGQWIMRDDGQAAQPDETTTQVTQLQDRYLKEDAPNLQHLNYTNCSSGADGTRRAEINNLVGQIKASAVSKTALTENLFNFVNRNDVNWTRVTGRRALGMGTWTGWKFNVKSEKLDEITGKAQGGDAYSQVLLWLNARFSAGQYLYPSGDHFMLEGSVKGEFGSLYGTDFNTFAKAKFGKVAAISEYNDAIQKISRTCNLHRALSGALAANGMKTEANAVMAGTA